MQQYTVQPSAVVAKVEHSVVSYLPTLSENGDSKVPETIPLDAAATVPDNFVTAFYTLFNQLGLPIPRSLPATSPPPLANSPVFIYGAGATSGRYMIQLLHSAGYKNILATASPKHHDFLRSLGATSLFDYRSPELTNEIARAVGQEGKVAVAVDCIATEKTLEQIAQVISPSGTVAVLLPVKKADDVFVDD